MKRKYVVGGGYCSATDRRAGAVCGARRSDCVANVRHNLRCHTGFPLGKNQADQSDAQSALGAHGLAAQGDIGGR